MKEDKTIAGLFGAVLIAFVWSCAGSSYKQMAISNPQKLISIEDSLLQLRPTTQIVNSIALAHEILGDSAMGRGDYEKAKKHFKGPILPYKNAHFSTFLEICKTGNFKRQISP